MPFRILSLDGGGIRGVYSATILKHLEKDLNSPIYQHFDLICGTSTGGILTAMLLCPDEKQQNKFSAKDIVGLYKNRGDEIFCKTFRQILSTGNGLFDERYLSEPFEKLIVDYASDLKLSQLLKPCVITSYDTVNRQPFMFKQHEAKNYPEKDFSIVDVCLSTAAAPTYFEPRNATNLEGKKFSLIDGGVFANNPALCGYIESLKLKKPNDDVIMVSIGTGNNNKKYPHEQIKDYGLLEWISPLIDILLDGTSLNPEYHIRKIFEDRQQSDNYFRINSNLPEELTKMDDTSPENIEKLIKLADTKVNELKLTKKWAEMIEKIKE